MLRCDVGRDDVGEPFWVLETENLEEIYLDI